MYFSSFLCVWSSLCIKVFLVAIDQSSCIVRYSDMSCGSFLLMFHLCVIMISIHKWVLVFSFNVFIVYLPYLTIPWFAFIKVVVLSLIYVHWLFNGSSQWYMYIPRVFEVSWLQLWPRLYPCKGSWVNQIYPFFL